MAAVVSLEKMLNSDANMTMTKPENGSTWFVTTLERHSMRKSFAATARAMRLVDMLIANHAPDQQ
jgi:hypothetical protein